MGAISGLMWSPGYMSYGLWDIQMESQQVLQLGKAGLGNSVGAVSTWQTRAVGMLTQGRREARMWTGAASEEDTGGQHPQGQVQTGAETRKGPQADEKAAPWRKGGRSHRSFQKRPGFRGLHIVDPRGKRERQRQEQGWREQGRPTASLLRTGRPPNTPDVPRYLGPCLTQTGFGNQAQNV